MAKKSDSKPAEKVKAMTKSAVMQELATKTSLTKKDVIGVFDELVELIKSQLGKKGPGVFTIPGLLKLKRVHKPATKERKGLHPITKQMTTFKAKPARNTVRARALKTLNDQIK
jgi:nucleoid DNA-binding protein